MILENELTSQIKKAFSAIFSVELSDDQITLQPTRKEFEGTHTLVCFPFSRLSKTGPEQTAQQLGEYLVENGEYVDDFNVVKGFLNLKLNNKTWISTFQSIYTDQSLGQLPDTGK